MSIRRIVRKAVGFWLKDKFERAEDIYLASLAFSLTRKGWCATRITSTASIAVIDGYPRSANSFAVRAFMEAQGGFVRVGNHTHSPANIIRGVRLAKPVLLVVREPKDAILGYCAWSDQTEGKLNDFLMRRQLNLFLKRYVSFHRKLLPYLDQIVVADFNEVTSDYGGVIVMLNERYGTDFNVFEHSLESQNKLFDAAPAHLSPSEERDIIKSKYLDCWEEIQVSSRVKEAYELYDQLR